MKEIEFRVSVIIPVYNAANFVQQAVESALRLEEVGEVILVEDGSKDNSLTICYALAGEDKRVKVLQHEEGKNFGAAVSRNLGIQNTTFPYIAFLDADDYYFENRFRTAEKIFKHSPKVDGVYEFVELINECTETKKIFGIQEELTGRSLFRYILRGGYFHTNAITVKREFIFALGFFNQDCWPHEDVEMWLRMAYQGCLRSGSRVAVAAYRLHGSNNIVNANSKTRRVLWKMITNRYLLLNITWLDRVLILKGFLKWNVLNALNYK